MDKLEELYFMLAKEISTYEAKINSMYEKFEEVKDTVKDLKANYETQRDEIKKITTISDLVFRKVLPMLGGAGGLVAILVEVVKNHAGR